MLYVRREPLPELVPSPSDQGSYSPRWPGRKLPPLYGQYHEYERRLPQHRWNAPSHASEPKYFWIAGHGRVGSGWGNVMQEILLNAHLSYKANRAYVFHNYTWNDDGSDYSDYNGKPIPSRVPLSALIRGPMIGEPWPEGDPAPLSVSEEYFYHACPERRVVPHNDVHDHLPSWFAADITKGWLDKLNSLDDQCVEAGADGGPPFNWVTFGDKDAMRDLWPELRRSPVLTHFAYSPLVELAFDTNREVFSPTSVLEPPLTSVPFTPSTPTAARYTEIPGLLVLHLRRGDYEGHCAHLARWSSSYMAYNALPELPDRFDPPPGGSWGENTPENVEIYMRHCFPTTAQILARVDELARVDAARGLRDVYVMTNGAVEWVEDLKRALRATGRWRTVASSRDLVLNWEQKYVAQAVDMLIGQRAQMLIGNGWSSLTGNIVVMRLANGRSAESTRFW
ncbi:hypothetical protein PYCCODRAFT_1376756 [Trametes coccinea BRFM310]|uniref:Uncharacterized protein n=1 Tax=Trametes coccinea (strain BRFM310) TaxID=1353009 RepID=A0A1Y2I922_TRAC3|nr:hypothetical protein PYCCODRAFT_1376756 [Trametes coccinea BRFM310]